MGASVNMGGNGGGRRGRRKRHAPMAEINVTPFVDVMLVLLIIFMVTAPMMATGVPIDLPKTGAQPLDQPKKEPLQISVSKDGKIYIGGSETPTAIGELKDKLKAIAASRGTDDPLIIRGDNLTEYGLISEVLTQITAAGFHKMALQHTQRSGGG